MSTPENIAEVNDRMVRAGFPFYRETLWNTLGDMPLRTAVRMLLATQRHRDKLSIVDVGCGCGDDLQLFKTLLRLNDFAGEISLHGCDLSPEMIRICHLRKLEGVEQGDFLVDSLSLPQADLLWCHFVLVHITPDKLDAAILRCASLALTNGVVGFGFKTGNDETRIDPADERVPVDREVTFHNPETVKSELAKYSLKVIADIYIPSQDPTYSYCWILTSKTS